MSSSAVRNRGYLFKLPVKGLVKKWSRRWFVLHATSHEGVFRMEYFDNEACQIGSIGKRTIPLRDCSGIQQSVGDKIHPYVFELQSQLGHHKFACESQPELEQWVECIKEALHEDKMKRRQRKTQSLVINRDDDGGFTDSKGASHINYSDITEGTYRVRIEQNETAIKMALEGEYSLQVSNTSLALVGTNSGATIAEWHYKYLKNYGKQHGRFHFETGKASPTGEGNFLCVTNCSKEIFGVVHRNIKKLREVKEVQRQATLNRQVKDTLASEKKIKAEKKTASIKKQSSADKGLQGHTSAKRSSQEIAGQSTTGRYRASRDLDEVADTQDLIGTTDESDPSHLYSTVNKPKKQEAVDVPPPSAEDDIDPSHLYATVNKEKKKTTAAASKPPKPQPYSSTAQAQQSQLNDQPDNPFSDIPASGGDTNRYSLGSARDSRDSAFIQLNLLGSFDEELENLPPLNEGAVHPVATNNPFSVPDKAEDLINFDFGQLNTDLGQLDTNFDPLDSNFDPLDSNFATGDGINNPAQIPLDQQQYDTMWDNILSSIPTADNPNM